MTTTGQGGSFARTTTIVCGGSKGIGKATALAVARAGGSLLLMAREPQALEAAAAEIEPLLGDDAWVDTVACDATDASSVGAAVDAFVDRHGVPDHLLNLVGAAHPAYVADLTLDDFRAEMETNYYGQLIPVLAVLPHMVRAGRGHVATTSSALGFMGVMGYATYAPTKYAVVGLTEVLRNEVAHLGVTFSVLFPPDTDTPGFEQENETKPAEWFATSASKLMAPEDVASAFVSGVARRRFYITPGQSSWLWRLARFAPRVLHWYVDRELVAARRRLGAS